jgi:hypothetical protein
MRPPSQFESVELSLKSVQISDHDVARLMSGRTLALPRKQSGRRQRRPSYEGSFGELPGEGEKSWRLCRSRRPRGGIPGPRSPPYPGLTSTSRTASLWSWSVHRGAASPPRCGCLPGSRRSTPAASTSATGRSPARRPRTGTSRWSSRTTRSTRTCPCATTWPSP